MRLFLTAAVLAAFLVSAPAPAAPGASCGDRDRLIAHLEEKYSERLAVRALMFSGAVLEVLVSPAESWTFLVTDTRGVTCILASGQAWQSLNEPEEINGDPV